jgi:hypothetical protein
METQPIERNPLMFSSDKHTLGGNSHMFSLSTHPGFQSWLFDRRVRRYRRKLVRKFTDTTFVVSKGPIDTFVVVAWTEGPTESGAARLCPSALTPVLERSIRAKTIAVAATTAWLLGDFEAPSCNEEVLSRTGDASAAMVRLTEQIFVASQRGTGWDEPLCTAAAKAALANMMFMAGHDLGPAIAIAAGFELQGLRASLVTS